MVWNIIMYSPENNQQTNKATAIQRIVLSNQAFV